MIEDREPYGPPAWLGIFLILIVAIFIFGCVEALAEQKKIEINVLRGTAPIHYSKAEAIRLMKRVQRKLRLIKVKKYIDLPMVNIPAENAFNIWGWADVYRFRHNITGPILLLAPPPLAADGTAIFLGRAEICNPGYGVAAGTFAPVTRLTGKEFAHATLIAMHEIGHLLGAQHDNTTEPEATIMHSSVLGHLEPQDFKIEFSDLSKKQMNRCLKTWGLKNKI